MNNGDRQPLIYLVLWHVAAVVLIELGASLGMAKPIWAMLPEERSIAGIFIWAYMLSVIWPSWMTVTRGSADKRIAYLLTLGIFIAAYFYAESVALEFRSSVGLLPLLVALVLLPFLCGGKVQMPHVVALTVLTVAGWYAALTIDDGGKFFKYAVVQRNIITTAFYNVGVQEYERRIPRRKNKAGGITRLGDRYLVLNGDGEFFLLNPDFESRELNVQRLAYAVPMQDEADDSAPRRTGAGTDGQSFRVTDVLAEQVGDQYRIYASYHYWSEAKACHVLRVAALQLSFDELLDDDAPAEWQTVHDTKPCLPIEINGKPFFYGNEAGGRMAVYDDERLMLTVGHQKLHGMLGMPNHSQDPATSYGKIWLIDKAGDGAEIFSLGNRNPQGLFIDEKRNIWSTEHGPEGGDELNLIEQGANYGWPLVTYGTGYGKFEWGLSKTQGRHEGYTQPLYAWVPSVGISSLIRLEGNGFPAWRGDLLVASLNGATLYRVVLDGKRVVAVEPIKLGSRLRDLVETDDGRIMIWTDNDKIIVLEPVGEAEHAEVIFAATCGGCHTIDGAGGKLGPDLQNVVNRSIGSLSDYEYSAALTGRQARWTPENLDAFMADPQDFAAGSTMEMEPVEDPAVREKLIDYLKRN